MPATLHHFASYGRPYRCEDVIPRVDALLQPWLEEVNRRYPQQTITTLKGIADDPLYCGWTWGIQQPEGRVIGQCVAGSQAAPAIDRNRIEVWFGHEAFYDPLNTTVGSHGLVQQPFQQYAAITSRNSGTYYLNLLAPAEPRAVPVDNVVFMGLTPGQEYFGWSSYGRDTSFHKTMPFLLARCQGNQRWLLMAWLYNSGWRVFASVPAPPSNTVAHMSSSGGLEPRPTGEILHGPVQLALTQSTEEGLAHPIRRYSCLQLPPDFVYTNEPVYSLVQGLESGREFFVPNDSVAVAI